jgi:hypothetical protein
VATVKELRELATEHEIKGRSSMDHVELTTALERAGAQIPEPAFPEAKTVRVEWRESWRLVEQEDGKWVREDVTDADWELMREVDVSEVDELKELAKQVWPHCEVRVVEREEQDAGSEEGDGESS